MITRPSCQVLIRVIQELVEQDVQIVVPIAAYNDALHKILGFPIRLLNGRGKGKDVGIILERHGGRVMKRLGLEPLSTQSRDREFDKSKYGISKTTRGTQLLAQAHLGHGELV